MGFTDFNTILQEACPQGATLSRAILKKSTGQLTVVLSFDVEPAPEERRKLVDTLKSQLPQLSITLNVESRSTASVHAPETVTPVAGPYGGVGGYAERPKENENVLLGREIDTDQRNRVKDLEASDDFVVVEGFILSMEEKEGYKGYDGKMSWRVQLSFTDMTDSITCSCSFNEQAKQARFVERISGFVGKQKKVLIRGRCRQPRGRELQLYPNDINKGSAVEQRVDRSEEGDKRVELHLHTRMSTLDGLTELSDAVMTAARWGHKAMAVTDHGVVQSFPHIPKAIKNAEKATGNKIKVLYGVEGYLRPDCELVEIPSRFVVFDLETTGLKPENCEIIEIGAVKLENGVVTDRFQTFVNDGELIPPNISALTHITNDMIEGAPNTQQVLGEFKKFVDGACLVGHNAEFDMGFIYKHGAKYGINFDEPFADTLMLSRHLVHDLPNHKLDTVCDYYDVSLENHHRAVDDAEATSQIFLHLMEDLIKQDTKLLPVQYMQPDVDKKKKSKTYHIILIAKTMKGLKNLYRIVSHAHLDYFDHGHPNIPRSLLSIYRQDIIVGSACEAGELFQAVFRGEDEPYLEKMASFYDFLEIQPIGNNAFMVRDGLVPDDDGLRELNKKIVALGDKLGIPVAATGDVHFLEPHHAEFRKLIMMKQGFSDADQQAPLYFKPTDEMLEEFSYLGQETAHRVVVEVPNSIAESCEVLKPFPDGTHSPEIPNASRELELLAINRAHEIYGDPLPDVVQARLDKELKSIIGNGFASLYLLAQRLVHKSNSDGYLVGSRGSVGSSFVATMAGITEVNALPPHYICPNPDCRNSDFDVDTSLYSCGVDLPDKMCPKCGGRYRKDGFTIPFEVFLGFHGDKTPDIDLNFSGEYQPRAHRYVEEMFGAGHAFKAGTISGLAEKKAYECVYSYMEKTGSTLRRAEMERLAKGCMDVKVTTGQHPGGIVVVPKEEDILDFTPVAYPADKRQSGIITTHFDFHSMDERLVKLDILGHDDPTALRMLEDITKINPRSVPLDDPPTREIFVSPEPLGVDLTGINCNVGSLGIPEFGTGFVRQVLEETKPRTMEEFVRIAGLTHGTDVWLNNAEPLVVNGIAKLNEVLCTRDDIMNYLMQHGMEPSFSFKVMESVRKGRGITEEQENLMKENSIPAWFIDSCHKIKYMFPRGHAVAYTMMSIRIAWFKVHQPEAFYAVYFTVRADAFDYTLAQGGPDRVRQVIEEQNKQAANAETAEKKRLKEMNIILELVYEMNLRGIKLLPIDIYKSDGVKFLIEPEGLRPPFNALPGVGANAAIQMAENRGTAPFLSVEDFQTRTGANSGIVSTLQECGCFKGLPQTNQISLF